MGEVISFDRDETAQAPLRDGQDGDEIELDDIAGTKVLDIGASEGEVRRLGFVGKDDLTGG